MKLNTYHAHIHMHTAQVPSGKEGGESIGCEKVS